MFEDCDGGFAEGLEGREDGGVGVTAIWDGDAIGGGKAVGGAVCFGGVEVDVMGTGILGALF